MSSLGASHGLFEDSECLLSYCKSVDNIIYLSSLSQMIDAPDKEDYPYLSLFLNHLHHQHVKDGVSHRISTRLKWSSKISRRPRKQMKCKAAGEEYEKSGSTTSVRTAEGVFISSLPPHIRWLIVNNSLITYGCREARNYAT